MAISRWRLLRFAFTRIDYKLRHGYGGWSETRLMMVRVASQQDIGLDPHRQFAHGDEDLGLSVARPHTTKRGGECFLLLRGWKLGDQEGVADGDLIFQERLGHRRDQVREANRAIDVRLAFRTSDCNAGNAIGGFSEFKQCPEPQSFLKRVDVLTLEIFNALGEMVRAKVRKHARYPVDEGFG